MKPAALQTQLQLGPGLGLQRPAGRGMAHGERVTRNRAAVLEQARRFEAALVQMLVQELRKGGLEEGFFGEGPGADAYGWLMDRHLSAALSGRMPLGLAETLVDQLEGTRHGLPETRPQGGRSGPGPGNESVIGFLTRRALTPAENETGSGQVEAPAADKNDDREDS